MHIMNLLVLLVTVSTFYWTATEGAGCEASEDHCVPLRHCPTYLKRVQKQEHKNSGSFAKELRQRICQPEEYNDGSTHICCPKKQIGCRLNEKPGVCLLQQQCPNLRSTTEGKLLESPKQNLCYVANQKNYFCCTEPHCVLHKTLCEQPVPSGPTNPPSAFVKCSRDKKQGTLVPTQLCDSEYSTKQTNSQSREVCCVPENPDRPVANLQASLLAKLPCGTNDMVVRIQDGTYAQRGEFPWMAYLLYKGKEVCGGTLIHPSYVLTARHCATSTLLKVRLGEYNLLEKGRCSGAAASDPNCLEPQEIGIAKKILHNSHDVALLRLSKRAAIDGHMVRPICLPVYVNIRMLMPKMVTITGWGLTEEAQQSHILLKAETPVVSSKVKGCTRGYEVCAGGKHYSNQCAGDSGGPYQAQAVFNGTTRFVQYGVISHGSAHCSNPLHPSKAVLVAYVLDWILDNMVL